MESEEGPSFTGALTFKSLPTRRDVWQQEPHAPLVSSNMMLFNHFLVLLLLSFILFILYGFYDEAQNDLLKLRGTC